MKEWRNIKKLHAAQLERNQALLKENRELKERIGILESEDKRKDATIQTLMLRVEELERMIFGKKPRKTLKEDGDLDDNQMPRKPAVRDQSSYQRSIPDAQDVSDEKYHTRDTCPDCKTPLKRIQRRVFYEEDIVLPTEKEKLKTVVKHTIEKGWCPSCRRWTVAYPLPLTRVALGKNVKLYLCYLSILIRLSFEQIKTLLKTTYDFDLSDGEIASILEKESRVLRPEYEALKDRIRQQKGVHYDETGWNVQEGTQGNHAWVVTGTQTNEAVFECGRSRGKGIAKALKGSAEHIGITDDYGAYRNLFIHHQLCFAHPQRKFRELAESDTLDAGTQTLCKKTSHEFSLLYADVRAVLSRPFDMSERAIIHDEFTRRFDEIASYNQADPRKLATLKETLRKNRTSYFTCLLHEGIPPDNNKAERALRHLVLKRKTSFGSKTERGAETTSILASVLLSLFWTKPASFFQEYMRLRGV